LLCVALSNKKVRGLENITELHIDVINSQWHA